VEAIQAFGREEIQVPVLPAEAKFTEISEAV
jgi:hypothetical protein